MIPKEKAKELLSRVYECVCDDINDENAKDMATIMCEKVIEALDDLERTEHGIVNGCYGQDDWREVITEICNLKVIYGRLFTL